MIHQSKTKEEIFISRNSTFIGIGVVAIFMAAVGVRFLFAMLPLEDGYTFADVFGVFFLAGWIMLVLCMGTFAFATNSKQVLMNSDGISCKSLFRTELMKWDDVKDWGISYCGQTRGEGDTYYLYFSDHGCAQVNHRRKRLKGKMIKTFIFESDYSKAVDIMVPFCSKKTDVVPFVAEV